MNYSSASPPITYGNVQMGGGHPSTPGIISSPQDANGDLNFNSIMKNVPSGAGGGNGGVAIQYHEQNLAHMVAINTDVVTGAHHSHLNNEIIDSMKHSPMQTTNQDHQGGGAGSMNDLNSYNHFGDAGVGLF
jgi:hypothetical protein